MVRAGIHRYRGPGLAAVRRSGARRQGLERRSRLRGRPAESPRAGVHAGRASTSRRCSSTAPARRTQSAAGLAFSPDTAAAVPVRRRLRQLAHRRARSQEPADPLSVRYSAARSRATSRARITWRRLEGQLYTGEVAPGARAQRFRLQGTLEHAAAQRADAGATAPRRRGCAGTARSVAPRRAFPAPGQARGGYPPWTSTMASPYRMTPNWPRLGDIKPGAAIGIIPDGKGGTWLHHRSEPPILHIDRGGQRRSPVRQRHVRAGARILSGPRRQLLGGRQRSVRRQPGDQGARVPAVQVQPRRQGAADARQGRRLEGRHATRSSVRPRARSRPTATSSWPTATGRGRPTRSRTAIGWCGSRPTARSSREYGKMGTAPGRVHGTARAGVRLAGTAVRGRSLEQPRAGLRSQHAVRRRVAPLRPAERHRDPQGRHAHRRRLRVAASSSAVRRRRPKAAATWCAIPAGATASGSAARRTARSRYYVQGTRPEGMGADNEGNVFAGLTGNAMRAPRAAACRSG